MNALRHQRHQRVSKARTRVLVLVALMAASIVTLPAPRALADGQVLELPQTAATSPEAGAPEEPYLPEPTRAAAPRRETARADPPPPGVDGIDAYMHQDDSDSPGAGAQPQPNYRTDPNANRSALVTDAVMAGIAIALFAFEVSSAHHRRHR